MSLCIVTAWLNAHELAPGYLEAIAYADADEVRVIDNGSEPRLDLPGCSVFRMDGNLGFSAACNLGLRLTRCDTVLFLNNDVRATTVSNWLQPFRDAIRPGVLAGAELRVEPHTGQHYLDGWCLGGTTDDLKALGGFDTGYEEPAYFSDVDLCHRARQAGMRLVQVDAGLRHLGNWTTRRIDVSAVSARNLDRFRQRIAA